jgi:hypothetical protein
METEDFVAEYSWLAALVNLNLAVEEAVPAPVPVPAKKPEIEKTVIALPTVETEKEKNGGYPFLLLPVRGSKSAFMKVSNLTTKPNVARNPHPHLRIRPHDQRA